MAKRKQAQQSELSPEQLTKLTFFAIGALLALAIIGVIAYEVIDYLGERPATVPAPVQPPAPEPAPVETPAVETAPEQNITQNITEPAANITQNITQNVTQNITIMQNTTPPAAPPAPKLEYTWENIIIKVPNLNTTVSGKNNYHYINITEIDKTILSNSEGFNLQMSLIGGGGIPLNIVPTIEKGLWLIQLRPTKSGWHKFTIEISCSEGVNHCSRFYPKDGKRTEITIFDAI